MGALAAGGAPQRAFSPAALRRLQAHDWPQNTADLVALCTTLARAPGRRVIPVDEVERLLAVRRAAPEQGQPRMRDKRQILVDALVRNKFRKTQTAEALGISRKTLYNWMKRHGIG